LLGATQRHPFDIGKKTVYKILKQNTTKYQTLTNLASSDVDACVEAGRLLVADMYAKFVSNSVNFSSAFRLFAA
jgi:hypothetical protein